MQPHFPRTEAVHTWHLHSLAALPSQLVCCCHCSPLATAPAAAYHAHFFSASHIDRWPERSGTRCMKPEIKHVRSAFQQTAGCTARFRLRTAGSGRAGSSLLLLEQRGNQALDPSRMQAGPDSACRHEGSNINMCTLPTGCPVLHSAANGSGDRCECSQQAASTHAAAACGASGSGGGSASGGRCGGESVVLGKRRVSRRR